MSTIPVQIRIDKETKEEASRLFKELGTDLPGVINVFLRQCVLTKSIPLQISLPERYEGETEVDEVPKEVETPEDDGWGVERYFA
ncbi:type II toxin-antitoxin system RelB/DinJ family antitoxin [Candidatus Saccharibacteria bacterium]|nr:type II toxin-antitoxin system RelB/DinJ family antitoxin [Candidatus Saccharibacteria bacterium]